MPCGILTRSICASLVCRWPYVPRRRRNVRHWSGVISPRSNRSSVATNSSTSRVSANDSLVRPKVFGSSTTDMSCSLNPECHDVADHDRAGVAFLYREPFFREIVERPAPDRLRRRRRAGDDRGWRTSQPAPIDQLPRNRRRSSESHQHDQGYPVRCEPFGRRSERRFVMCGRDEERARDAAMCDRDTRRRRRRHRARHAWHDLACDARVPQGKRFLAAASEDERITALQTHDVPAAPGGADHQAVNGVLRHRVTAGALADEEALSLARALEDALVDERIVED